MTDLRTDVTTPVKEEDEKTLRRRMDAMWWGGTLIWIGLALGLEWADVLPGIGDDRAFWPWIFIGIGPWSLALNAYFANSRLWPNPSTADWVWTTIFMLVALGTLINIGGEIFGAIALLTIGVIILSRAIMHRD